MARKNIMSLNGWDDIISRIEKAGGTIDDAAEKCLKESAEIVRGELVSQMKKSGVETDLINRMPDNEIERDRNVFRIRIGYRKGSYDPKNPSDGYKVVFLNYGTPHREKHGKVAARGFIQRAKGKAAKPVKSVQEETLHEILKELEK